MFKKSAIVLMVMVLLVSMTAVVLAEDDDDNSAKIEETEDGKKVYTGVKDKTDPDDSTDDTSKAHNNPLYVAGS